MKRLDRHVLWSFVGAWAAAVVFFIGMYLVIHFFSRMGSIDDAAENVTSQGYSAAYGFARYYVVTIPFILVEVLPFTIVMAAMWTFQQMSRRNELVPVAVAGVSFRRLAMTPLLAGVVLSLGFAALREQVLPRLAPERHRLERMFKGADDSGIRNLPIVDDGSGKVVLVREFEAMTDLARGMEIRSRGAPSRPGIFAEAARFRESGPAGPGWYPEPASDERLDRTKPLPTTLKPGDLEIEARSLQFLDVVSLEKLRRRHSHRRDLEVLLQGHYAYPLRAIVLLLIGFPLVLRFTRQSPYVAVGLSLLVSIAFFALQSVLEELGRRGEYLTPALGVWLPVALFGAAGLVFFASVRS